MRLVWLYAQQTGTTQNVSCPQNEQLSFLSPASTTVGICHFSVVSLNRGFISIVHDGYGETQKVPPTASLCRRTGC